MAAFDYADAAATATELLTDFGTSCTVTRVVEGVYNPATGTVTNTTTNQTGIGVLLEYSTQEAGALQQAGTLVQATDRKLLLSVSGITNAPEPNDTVTFNGATYTVMQAKTLSPAGVVVLYECMVRR